MDEIVRHLQGRLKKVALDGFDTVSVWVGVARRRAMTSMEQHIQTMPITEEPKPREVKEPELAEVIEFYVPRNFVRTVRWIPSWRRGKLIQFQPARKKTA